LFRGKSFFTGQLEKNYTHSLALVEKESDLLKDKAAELNQQGAGKKTSLVSKFTMRAKEALSAGQSNIKLNETLIMLVVLGLIDVVMISNLLIMVIIGGYETFVSRLNIDGHPDQPEWLSHVNASVLKVKLGMAIIGISSIHLLKTFINAEQTDTKTLMWQTLIHLTFLASALAIAWTDRIISHHYEHE